MCVIVACSLGKVYVCIPISIIPMLFTLLYASKRFIFFWFMAPIAPIAVESAPHINNMLCCVSNVINTLIMAIFGINIIIGRFIVFVPS